MKQVNGPKRTCASRMLLKFLIDRATSIAGPILGMARRLSPVRPGASTGRAPLRRPEAWSCAQGHTCRRDGDRLRSEKAGRDHRDAVTSAVGVGAGGDDRGVQQLGAEAAEVPHGRSRRWWRWRPPRRAASAGAWRRSLGRLRYHPSGVYATIPRAFTLPSIRRLRYHPSAPSTPSPRSSSSARRVLATNRDTDLPRPPAVCHSRKQSISLIAMGRVCGPANKDDERARATTPRTPGAAAGRA